MSHDASWGEASLFLRVFPEFWKFSPLVKIGDKFTEFRIKDPKREASTQMMQLSWDRHPVNEALERNSGIGKALMAIKPTQLKDGISLWQRRAAYYAQHPHGGSVGQPNYMMEWLPSFSQIAFRVLRQRQRARRVLMALRARCPGWAAQPKNLMSPAGCLGTPGNFPMLYVVQNTGSSRQKAGGRKSKGRAAVVAAQINGRMQLFVNN